MKFLPAFAALLLALTSVAAEASQSCFGPDHLTAPAAFIAGAVKWSGPDCHDAAGAGVESGGSGCEFAAFCALLCGVVPPEGPEKSLTAQFEAIDFFANVDSPSGALWQPEAPPPRFVAL